MYFVNYWLKKWKKKHAEVITVSLYIIHTVLTHFGVMKDLWRVCHLWINAQCTGCGGAFYTHSETSTNEPRYCSMHRMWRGFLYTQWDVYQRTKIYLNAPSKEGLAIHTVRTSDHSTDRQHEWFEIGRFYTSRKFGGLRMRIRVRCIALDRIRIKFSLFF